MPIKPVAKVAIRGAVSMQSPRMAYVRHGVPGDPIEIVVVIDGKQHAVAVGDRLALDISADLTRGVASNLTDDGRRGLCLQPRAGSRG